MLRCDSHSELYPLVPPTPEVHTAIAPSINLWHLRLGHPGRRVLQQSLPNLEFSSTKQSSSLCEACQLGKHVRLTFVSSTSVSYVPFQLVHADIWTSPVVSFSGFKFYLVLIDDFTHSAWTFPLRAKSEAFPCIQAFHAYVSTQFQLP